MMKTALMGGVKKPYVKIEQYFLGDVCSTFLLWFLFSWILLNIPCLCILILSQEEGTRASAHPEVNIEMLFKAVKCWFLHILSCMNTNYTDGHFSFRDELL